MHLGIYVLRYALLGHRARPAKGERAHSLGPGIEGLTQRRKAEESLSFSWIKKEPGSITATMLELVCRCNDWSWFIMIHDSSYKKGGPTPQLNLDPCAFALSWHPASIFRWQCCQMHVGVSCRRGSFAEGHPWLHQKKFPFSVCIYLMFEYHVHWTLALDHTLFQNTPRWPSSWEAFTSSRSWSWRLWRRCWGVRTHAYVAELLGCTMMHQASVSTKHPYTWQYYIYTIHQF